MIPPPGDWCRGVVAAAIVLASLAGCARPRPAVSAWESIPLGTDAEIEDLWFADSLNGWLVGGGHQIEGGLVGRTRDGGLTWTYTSGLASREPGVFRFNLTAVRFLDAGRGLIAATGGKIFITDDAGEHWRLARYGRSATDHLFAFDFLDPYNGWAAGLAGALRTRDGGENWEEPNRELSPYERPTGHAIRLFDASHGFMAGRDGALFRTVDGGQTWFRVVTPLGAAERPMLYDLWFADVRHGWVVGAEGTVLHTTDGGSTWTRQETGVAGARSEPKLQAVQRRRGVVDTFDLGERTPGLTLTAVRFLDPGRGWAVGHFGYEGRSVVLASQDGGASWRIEQEAAGEELRALFVLDAEHAWAAGDRVRPGAQTLLRRTPATVAAAAATAR